MPRVPDLPCAQCGKLMWRSKSSLPEGEATCLPCRRSGDGPFKHGIRAYDKRGCRCEICSAAKTAQNRRYAERFREQHGFSLTQKYRPATKRTRRCRRCGKGKVMRDLCSRCQVARAARQRAAARKAERAAAGTSANPRWPWVQGICAWCCEPFLRKGAPSSYCSKQLQPQGQPQGRVHLAERAARDLRAGRLDLPTVLRSGRPGSALPGRLGGFAGPHRSAVAHAVPGPFAVESETCASLVQQRPRGRVARGCGDLRVTGRWHGECP